MIIRSKCILSSALIMKMVMFGMFAADGTVLADEGVTITCPSDYPNSDAGATSENDCWRECTTDDVANSMSVVGKNYYGTGIDTCEPTQCAAGWVLKDLTEIVGEERATNSASVNYYGKYNEQGASKGQDYYGITEINSFAVEYGEGTMIIGHGRCSTQPGVGVLDTSNNPKDVTVVNNLIDETGNTDAKYCYCKIDEYTDMYGMKVKTLATPWFFRNAEKSSQECSTYCANSCGISLGGNGTFRIAMFEKAVPATCEEVAYTLKSGVYLPAKGNTPADCPSGSYCSGGAFVRYDEEKDQGLIACPVDYPNSDTGAKSENDCYKLCTTDDVANSMSVTGKNYYGTGTDTCEPTECMAGWYVKPSLNIGETIGTDKVNSSHGVVNGNNEFKEYLTSYYGQEYYGISDKNTFAVNYAGKGLLTGRASCQPRTDPALEYFWNNVFSVGGDISREEFYAGLVSAGGTTKADILMDYYEADRDRNMSDEETTLAYKNYYATFVEKDANYSMDSTGQYCYCQVDGFTPVGGAKQIVTPTEQM